MGAGIPRPVPGRHASRPTNTAHGTTSGDIHEQTKSEDLSDMHEPKKMRGDQSLTAAGRAAKKAAARALERKQRQGEAPRE